MIPRHETQPSPSAVLISETLHITEKETEVVFTTKTTYKVLFTHKVTAKTMHTAIRTLDTETGANVVHSFLIPTWSQHRIRLHCLLGLQTDTTTSPARRIETSLSLLCLCDFYFRVWFDIAPHLAVDISLGTALIDRSIGGIFPTEIKVLPWNFRPVSVRQVY